MDNNFRPLKGFWPQFFYVLWMPLFFLAFTIVFRPEPFLQYIGPGAEDISFILSILAAIVLVVVLLSRLLQLPWREKINTQNKFVALCLIEFIFIGGFSSLFLSLYKFPSSTYFDTLYKTSGYLLPILLIGYALAVLFLIALHFKYRQSAPVSEDVRLKFYDSNHLLKLTLSASSLLYIEADENYINVCYKENDTLKQKTLRSSMKRIDEMCQSCGIVRCHRSFFVNSAHIKVLRKDKEGVIYIELDHGDTKHIPVSKRYYDKISEML